MAGPLRLRWTCVAVPWAVTLGSALLVGCPDSPPPPAPGRDSGPPPDAPAQLVDSDGDGLCNETEHIRGTDPFDPDTDADGYSDYVEVLYGYDPLRPASPDRSRVVALTERPSAGIQVPLEITVRGGGEDFTGAFESLYARDTARVTAADFFDQALALYANPEGNVAEVLPEAQRFRAVVGTTTLHFELRFSYGEEDLVRRCLRAYPFRYVVKRSDARIVSSLRYLLVVVPDGETIARGQWCTPDPPCM